MLKHPSTTIAAITVQLINSRSELNFSMFQKCLASSWAAREWSKYECKWLLWYFAYFNYTHHNSNEIIHMLIIQIFMLFALEQRFSSPSCTSSVLHFSINKSFCISKIRLFFPHQMNYDAFILPRPFFFLLLNTCFPHLAPSSQD